MTEIKRLVRVSQKIQQAWLAGAAQARCNEQYFLDRLTQGQEAMHTAWRYLEKARHLHLDLIVPQLHERLVPRLQEVRDATVRTSKQLEQSVPVVPSIGLLVAELQAVEAEFDYLNIDWEEKYLSVATEPITLEEVELGPFAIQLFWERLNNDPGSRIFDVTALDPNPVASNDTVTHPHVRDRKLCAGEAKLPQEQSRTASAFHPFPIWDRPIWARPMSPSPSMAIPTTHCLLFRLSV